MTEKEILEKIVALRKERRMSQRKLAGKLGVSSMYLSMMERGKVKLSLRRFLQICEALEVKPHRILESRNKNPEREEILMNIVQDLLPQEMELLLGIAQMMRDQLNLQKNR